MSPIFQRGLEVFLPKAIDHIKSYCSFSPATFSLPNPFFYSTLEKNNGLKPNKFRYWRSLKMFSLRSTTFSFHLFESRFWIINFFMKEINLPHDSLNRIGAHKWIDLGVEFWNLNRMHRKEQLFQFVQRLLDESCQFNKSISLFCAGEVVTLSIRRKFFNLD